MDKKRTKYIITFDIKERYIILIRFGERKKLKLQITCRRNAENCKVNDLVSKGLTGTAPPHRLDLFVRLSMRCLSLQIVNKA